MRECRKCGKFLDEREFYARSDGKIDHRCKGCHREYRKSHYNKNRDAYLEKARKSNIKYKERNRGYLIEFLSDHPCVDCGNDDIEVLQFDHRDPSMKESNIASMLNGSLEALIREVEKCDVRCANCHTKKTRRQLGWWISQEE